MKSFMGVVSMAFVLWTASPANAASITKVTNTATAIPVTQLKGGPNDGEVLGLDLSDPTKSYLFDPIANAWSDGPTNAQLPSGEYPVIMTDGTYVAIANGCGANASPNIWDPMTMSFHTGAPAPYSINNPFAAIWAESADSVAILANDCTNTPRFFAYSISTNTWTTRSLPPVSTTSLLGSAYPLLLPLLTIPRTSSVFETMVVGGRTFFFSTSASYRSAYAYDPNTDTWATYANVLPGAFPSVYSYTLTIFQGSTKVAFVDESTGFVYLYDTSTPATPARRLPDQPTPPLPWAAQQTTQLAKYFFIEGSKSYCFALARTDMGLAPMPVIWDEATESFLPMPCSVTQNNPQSPVFAFNRYTFQLADGRFLSGYGTASIANSGRFASPEWWIYDPPGETALGESCACTNDCLSGVCALDSSDAANTCVECAHDDNCAGNPNGPICDPQKHVCGSCSAINDTQCPANAAFCDTSGALNQCVGCDGNLGSNTPFACSNPNQPVCGTSGAAQGMCVECTSNQFCGATAPVCDPQTFRCVPACSACSDGGGGDGGDAGDGGTTDNAEASADDNTGGNPIHGDVLASGDGGCSAMPRGQTGASTDAFVLGMISACLAFARRRVTCPRGRATHRLL
ncbi:MAG: hypothetical protein FWD69_05160 [Polyangiaceae bacterium]|nr:hypothetical protein [Polyangiaceae bacterium]